MQSGVRLLRASQHPTAGTLGDWKLACWLLSTDCPAAPGEQRNSKGRAGGEEGGRLSGSGHRLRPGDADDCFQGAAAAPHHPCGDLLRAGEKLISCFLEVPMATAASGRNSLYSTAQHAAAA